MTAALFPGYIFEPVEAPRFPGGDRRPWISYARLSRKDPREGFGQHVKMDDQDAQNCAYIERVDPGAEVIRLRDNKSAFLPEVHREGYEHALALIARGEVKGIVAIHSDRVTRQVAQASTMWDHLERTGAQLHTTHTGWIQDPTMMQMEAVIAERESRIKRERQKNHHRRLAKDGKMHGGHRRFGYEPDMKHLREDEAGALRSIAARVLAGESLASCVRWLEAEGFASVLGGKWTASNLGTMLKRPMLAGLRVHGQRADGTWRVVAPADWPAVFDLETHEALVRKLSDPARRTTRVSNKSKYLLAGLARCAACDEVLRGRPGKRDKAQTIYSCATGAHVQRRTELVDDALVRLVVARLSDSDSAGVFSDDSAESEAARLTVKRDELLARRQDYIDRAKAGTIDADFAAEVATAIGRDLSALQVELDAAREAHGAPLAVLAGMTGPLAQEAWDALTEAGQIGRQRAILRLLCKRITLAGGQREWDPQKLLRVEFHDRPQGSYAAWATGGVVT